MELVYDRETNKVCVCEVCHTGVNVPGAAWDTARQRGFVMGQGRV